MPDLIKILETRKTEATLQIERDKKDKEKENKRILKEAQQQRATDLIREYNRYGLPSDVSRDTEWLEEYKALRYNPDGGGGKKKRTKRKKTRSYRKNKRTKRNKNKKNKNKNPKNN
jgi:hypothetical protein